MIEVKKKVVGYRTRNFFDKKKVEDTAIGSKEEEKKQSMDSVQGLSLSLSCSFNKILLPLVHLFIPAAMAELYQNPG